MPALLSGCRSGANFDSLPRGQRGPNAAIHKLNIQRLNNLDGDDFGSGSESGHAHASSSSQPSTPRIGSSWAGSGANSASQPASPAKDRRRQADYMRPVENIPGASGAAAKVERARSSPFPQSAPTSPHVSHAQAHSHHGAGTPTRAKHRIVDKRQIGLPTNFQHTGHIGRASYSAATSMMDTAAIQAQLSQVAAALNMDINLDKPAEEQIPAVTSPSEPEARTEAVESPPSPIMEPLPCSQPPSPSKRDSVVPSAPTSPSKANKTLPTPPTTSNGYAETSIRVVPPRDATALPSVPSAPVALPPEPAPFAFNRSMSPSPAVRSSAMPSTVSPASNHQGFGASRPHAPRMATAGPAQGLAGNGPGLRRKPVPRASAFVELTPEERAAKEEADRAAVALQRKASSASATKKLESLRRDMLHGLPASSASEMGALSAALPEEQEGSSAVDSQPVPERRAAPASPRKAMATSMQVPASASAGGGLAVPGASSPQAEPSIGSQLLAPRFLSPADPSSSSSASAAAGDSGLPRGTIRINGQAFVEGPTGDLISKTANTRWNSALAEITAALASGDAGADAGGGLPAMMSKEEEEALMLRMGIPLGPSKRTNQPASALAIGAAPLPSETVRLKAELADAALALRAFDADGEGGR